MQIDQQLVKMRDQIISDHMDAATVIQEAADSMDALLK